jgi:hypothetical protein
MTAAGGDDVFRHLVLARIIEPSSKLDSLRVLEVAGVAPASCRTLKRRLPACAEEAWRQRLSEVCAAHPRLGPASLALYDVSTLYFEAGQADGFQAGVLQLRRGPGYAKVVVFVTVFVLLSVLGGGDPRGITGAAGSVVIVVRGSR